MYCHELRILIRNSTGSPNVWRENQIRTAPWAGVARPRVVLDANALMLPFQFRVNLDAEITRILGECDVFVPSSVVRELERIESRDRAAKGARALAAKYKAHATERTGDAAVIEAAESLGATVVTNDAGLLAALKARRIPRISLRSRNHLSLEP